MTCDREECLCRPRSEKESGWLLNHYKRKVDEGIFVVCLLVAGGLVFGGIGLFNFHQLKTDYLKLKSAYQLTLVTAIHNSHPEMTQEEYDQLRSVIWKASPSVPQPNVLDYGFEKRPDTPWRLTGKEDKWIK